MPETNCHKTMLTMLKCLHNSLDFDSFSTFCVTGFFLFWLVLIHLVHFVSLDSFYFGQF